MKNLHLYYRRRKWGLFAYSKAGFGWISVAEFNPVDHIVDEKKSCPYALKLLKSMDKYERYRKVRTHCYIANWPRVIFLAWVLVEILSYQYGG